MPLLQKNYWQSAPFIRLLIPFAAGILCAYYFNLSNALLSKIACPASLLLICFSALSVTQKFKWMVVSGWAIQTVLFVFGAITCNNQDLQKNPDWLGYHYSKNDKIIAIIQEPLIPKKKTWKILAKVIAVQHQGKWLNTKSNILIYLKNNQLATQLETGDEIEVAEPLQKISNNSSMGAFDFVRYCAFQQIYFQMYIPENGAINYRKSNKPIRYYLYQTRNHILDILKSAIPNKTEQSVAEALLIGYKEDLDRSLVQSYSNTGVVHIIAISGLHLAMIYGLLIRFLQPFGNKKWNNFLRTMIVLSVLWGFSFITGGAAAILRSAVGFSFLLISKSLGYKNNSINAMAASAFFLLCYNPFLLWDIGFQLSYTAVLGIILFAKHIEYWCFFKNKLLQMIWQINSITIAAQVLTLPIVLYQFHQFPNLFLFTNFLIVPLSGIILYAEILVIVVSPFSILLKWTGLFTQWLIAEMNGIIERTNRIPFALTKNLFISLPETILLYLFITTIVFWLLYKNSKSFIAALTLVCLLLFIRSLSFF